jgi:hypothetical protein
MFTVLLILIVAFLPETLYPRGAMIERGGGALAVEKVDVTNIDLKRTKQLPFLVRFQQIQLIVELSSCSRSSSSETLAHASPFRADAVVTNHRHLCSWILLPRLLVAALHSYNVPSCVSRFRPDIQGLLMIGLILGTLVSEIFLSGRLSD